jgi:ketosteroid isomerase-like protein
MSNKNDNTKILFAVNLASNRWQLAFNKGDYKECTEQYEENAVMNVEPFGRYEGKEEIMAFWKNLVEDGFNNVEYLQPRIDVIDETSAVLTAEWKMNKAAGTISKELWVLQSDGTAKLKEDNFEVQA